MVLQSGSPRDPEPAAAPAHTLDEAGKPRNQAQPAPRWTKAAVQGEKPGSEEKRPAPAKKQHRACTHTQTHVGLSLVQASTTKQENFNSSTSQRAPLCTLAKGCIMGQLTYEPGTGVRAGHGGSRKNKARYGGGVCA